jgi:alkanesulfonate monooxygenase SsuD/methylene tetrahydromethanopterin reductase-like flavin-dependent oxidoreductase (luciferase family)
MQATLAGHDALVNPAVRPINAAFARGDVGTPEEVAERINRDILPVGFNHVSFALADAKYPRP